MQKINNIQNFRLRLLYAIVTDQDRIPPWGMATTINSQEYIECKKALCCYKLNMLIILSLRQGN